MRRVALACIIAAIAAPQAAAAERSLGRLFFTPSQRTSLDVARSQRTRVTVATERTEQTAQPVPQTITYGGMVRRSDGRTTVWLNDRPVNDQKPARGPTIIHQVRPDGAVTLEVPQSNRRVDLKVGQSVEVLSGSVGDGYRSQSAGTADNATRNGGATRREREKARSLNEGNRQGPSASERATPQESRAATAGSR